MEYITGTKPPEEKRCFLCIDEGKDDGSLVIDRLGKAFVIMNRFPYTNGHVMVVPVRHTGLMEDLSDEESLDIMRLVRKMVRVYKEEFRVEGINIGINLGPAAGAGWKSTTTCTWCRAGSGHELHGRHGETRVISEHLMTSYERLKRRFRETVL
jgi:ATP adenylyltransferase